MNKHTIRYVHFLEQLSLVIECAAVNSIGEAETELEKLCTLLETDDRFQFDSWIDIHDELTRALMTYHDGEYLRAASILSGVSRRLWKIVEDAFH